MTPPPPDRADSPVPQQFVPRCLDWVERYLDWFEPATWDAHFPPREIPTQTVLELLLLCRVLQRTTYAGERRPLIERAQQIALAGMAEPDFAAGLRRVDDQFPYLAWVLALAGDDGEVCTALRAQVQRTVDAYGPAITSIDWPVMNVIELRYILDLGGFDSDLPGFDELRGEEPYGESDPLRSTENEVYTITHEVLYAARFGEAALTLTPAGRDQLVEAIRSQLAIQLAEGQLDVSAELLHCLLVTDGPTVDGPGAELARLGWQRLFDGQLSSGAVPGPPYDAEMAAGQEGDDAAAYEFRTCYHTVLVAAMSAAATEAGLSAASARTPDPTPTRRPAVGARLRQGAAEACDRLTTVAPSATEDARPDLTRAPEHALTADPEELADLAQFVTTADDLPVEWLSTLPGAVGAAGRAGLLAPMATLAYALLRLHRRSTGSNPSTVVAAAVRRLLVEQGAGGSYGDPGVDRAAAALLEAVTADPTLE